VRGRLPRWSRGRESEPGDGRRFDPGRWLRRRRHDAHGQPGLERAGDAGNRKEGTGQRWFGIRRLRGETTGEAQPKRWFDPQRWFSRLRRGRGRAGAYRPIEDYALIGDRITAALVSKDGSIDWACFPRMDSPSVFARILDARIGGYWQIRPEGVFSSTRHYEDDTAILETTFLTDGGEARLIDFMPPHAAGLERALDSAIIRIVECVRGSMAFENGFDPRFAYARAAATWTEQPGTGVRATWGDESLTLQTKQLLEVVDGCAVGRFVVNEGERAVFVLTYRSPVSLFWRSEVEGEADHLLEQTRAYWRDWIGRCKYEGPYESMVKRSAITLRLLDFAPTGAMVAAPTTSLPEKIGGVRNWDYRFSWMRDTTFTLYSFYVLGYHEEGETFLSWILDMTRGDPKSLKVLYGIRGEQETPEFELDHLEGYMGSRPVRIGNAAQDQVQHDIYGELLDCAYLLYRYGGRFSDELWPLLRAAVNHVCDVWQEPDEGLWEVRSGPRQFVYSKALCWVAVDRGIRLAEQLAYPYDEERWKATRAEILEEIMEKGYDSERGAFTQAYGYRDLDAAVLSFPLRGVIAATDPRMASTVARIEEELGTDGLVRRVSQTFADGLPGGEGAFVLCSFWLVDCYILMGQTEKARAAYEKLLTYANDLGLLSEEIDPKTGAQLGNFPQAFAHVALINTAANLARADRDARARVEEPTAAAIRSLPGRGIELTGIITAENFQISGPGY